MEKITRTATQLVLDKDIEDRLFSLIPEGTHKSELYGVLDKLNEDDKNWVLSVVDKTTSLIKEKRKYYIFNQLLFVLLICDIIAFIVFGGVNRNSEHGGIYYGYCVFFLAVALGISLISKYIRHKNWDKKLKASDL